MRISFTVDISEAQIASIIEAHQAGRGACISMQARAFEPILAPPWKDDLLEPRWLTVEGASRYTGFSDGTIRRAIRWGAIRSFLVKADPQAKSGRRIIDRISIDDWIQSGSPGWPQMDDEWLERKKIAESRAETRRQIEVNKAEWAKNPQT
jgi:hypothetical protein